MPDRCLEEWEAVGGWVGVDEVSELGGAKMEVGTWKCLSEHPLKLPQFHESPLH